MKRFLPFLVALLMIFSCRTESDVEPAGGSFMRYFGSENNQDAVLALETENGYSLLSNVEIQKGATEVDYKIRLTRTDKNGNYLGDKTFPEFVNEEDEKGSARGFSFIPLANSGYLIVGEWINSNGSSELLLLRTDPEGVMQDSITLSAKDVDPTLSGASLQGRAVIEATDANGPFFIALSHIKGTSSDDMLVTRINAQDLSPGWKREYGAGTGSVINKLYSKLNTDNTLNLFWAGSVAAPASLQHDVRLIKAPTDSESSIIASPRVTAIDENALDFCPASGGWAITGSTNKSGNENIYLLKVNAESQFVYEQEITPVIDGEADPQLNDRGNSICQSIDGGLMILGTVDTEASQQDLFLVKTEGITGNTIWKKRYGGADNEEGASIRTTTDGHYLVFGTISFGRARKLILMKLDRNGEL
jgi:hypothetical protein